MSRRGFGDGIVGAGVVANAINQTAGRKTKILWMICGWSVVVALFSPILVATWSFWPVVGMFGLVMMAVGLFSFVITLFIGMMLFVFKL